MLIAVLAAMTAHGKLASDLPTGIALVTVDRFACAELAKRIPWIRHIAATSIFAAIVPSMLVYYRLMTMPVTKAVSASRNSRTSCTFPSHLWLFSTAVTYPLMFAISVAMTRWGEIVTAFHGINIVTAVSTVLALTLTGFFVARRIGMYPVEAAIVNAAHSGLGGT